MTDTICALSTPQGVGAIGVIRLSGGQSLAIVNSVFQGKDLLKQKANTLHFGKIVSGDQVFDEVVVSLFKAPHSYTGEDVVEISCHGSPFVQSEIMKLFTKGAARMAREGEFTFRAFMNGKLDLSQAEAVADLIESDSTVSRELALNQLRGGYSNRLQVLRQKLVDFASMLELELDFSEEDVDFANRDELKNLITEIQQAIETLMKSFDQGNVLKHGVPVAIIGEPNVGKSTLLNAILQEERAIVSDIPGTTRDFIEDDISIGGIMFRFIDTAGLRETEDHIESKGIEKTREKAEMARVVLRMVDVMNVSRQSAVVSGKEGGSKLELYVLNKIDQIDDSALSDLKKELGEENVVYLSAKEGIGVDELLDRLLEFVKSGTVESSGEMVTNIRHLEALKKSDEALSRSLEGLQNNISSELVAMDVRQALHYLGEITGEVTSDDLLGNIFSRFCIGK